MSGLYINEIQFLQLISLYWRVTGVCIDVISIVDFVDSGWDHNYTECPRRNGQNFGRAFLMLNYTDITQNTYIQSWTFTEIMAREVWNFDSCYTLID